MFLACGEHQQRWLSGLFVIVLVLLLGSACSGGNSTSQENSTADTTTTAETTRQDITTADTTTTAGGGEQASEDALDTALEKSFQESGAPGVVAAVQTPQNTWIRALEVADTTSKAPMTPEVHHRIGSVTKTFTVSLLLQAEADGLLSLEAVMNSIRNGLRMPKTADCGGPSQPDNPHPDAVFTQVHNTL